MKPSILHTSRYSGLTLHFVKSYKQLLEALHLNYSLYLEKGYTQHLQSGMRIASAELLRPSFYFSIYELGKLVGSFASILDSVERLPSDCIFSQELNVLRARGNLVCEASRMTSQGSLIQRQKIAMLLAAQILLSSKSLYADQLVMTVNPAHKDFWIRKFNMTEISRSEKCAHVEGAEGVFLHNKTENLTSIKSIQRYLPHLVQMPQDVIPTIQYLKPHQIGLIAVANLVSISQEDDEQRLRLARRFPFLQSLIEKENIALLSPESQRLVNCEEYFSDLFFLIENRLLSKKIQFEFSSSLSDSLNDNFISLNLILKFTFLLLSIIDRVTLSRRYCLSVSTGIFREEEYCHVSLRCLADDYFTKQSLESSTKDNEDEMLYYKILSKLLSEGCYYQLRAENGLEMTFSTKLYSRIQCSEQLNKDYSLSLLSEAAHAA